MPDAAADILERRVAELEERAERFSTLLDGDERLGYTGLRRDIAIARQDIEMLKTEREKQRNMLRGIGIGLGVTGVTGAGTLGTLIAQLVGG